MIIVCIISFIIGALVMMCEIGVVSNCKEDGPRNKVHFYVTRDRDALLNLWINKPSRGITTWCEEERRARHIAVERYFELFSLNPSDYKNLKWEDEPIEVLLNLED